MPVKTGRDVIPVHFATRENNPFPLITMGRFAVLASICSEGLEQREDQITKTKYNKTQLF